MPTRLILASASPRRRDLLAQAGYTFSVQVADVDESLHDGEEAGAYVSRLAEQKARVVFERCASELPSQPAAGELVVLGADTCVLYDGPDGSEILGKPCSVHDARRMLRMLAGRVHRVLTGVALVSSAGVQCAVETTEVTFTDIPEPELDAYCATSEPMDKAGAYGIQGYAARWIPRIEGCYFNVMGLPIACVVRLMEEVQRQ